MEDYILTLYDENGNPIPIPAIQGIGIKEIRLKEEGKDADAYEIVLDDDRVFVFYVKHGKSGISPTLEVSKSGKVTTITITDVNGVKTATIRDGADGTGGGAFFTPGNTLELTPDGILDVKTTDYAEQDNTLPITSSGVHTIVGNIGAILDTI